MDEVTSCGENDPDTLGHIGQDTAVTFSELRGISGARLRGSANGYLQL